MERRPRRFAAAEALRLLQLDDSFDEDINFDDLPDDDNATILCRQVEMPVLLVWSLLFLKTVIFKNYRLRISLY